MSPGPFQRRFVMDREAYEQKREELTKELRPNHEQWEFNNMVSRASNYGYSTEFSQICTAAIRGDWEPAKERCRKERAEKGEALARALMRSYQKAVREREVQLGMRSTKRR